MSAKSNTPRNLPAEAEAIHIAAKRLADDLKISRATVDRMVEFGKAVNALAKGGKYTHLMKSKGMNLDDIDDAYADIDIMEKMLVTLTKDVDKFMKAVEEQDAKDAKSIEKKGYVEARPANGAVEAKKTAEKNNAVFTPGQRAKINGKPITARDVARAAVPVSFIGNEKGAKMLGVAKKTVGKKTTKK